MTDKSENVPVALGLVVAAGASTGLGAAVVFFPSIVKLASRRVLAGSLGFSAGVMTYVSFVEIFAKAQLGFIDAGHAQNKAYVYASACFFAGVITMMILNVVVAKLLGGHSHRQDAKGAESEQSHDHGKKKKNTTREDVKTVAKDEDCCNPPCCSKDPVGQLEKFQKMASVLKHEQEEVKPELSENGMDVDIEDDFVENLPVNDEAKEPSIVEHDEENVEDDKDPDDKKTTDENERLVKMGMNTAVAIGLHNFPEGLATFVAALDDPRVGSILAFAIAIHNIPEGLCVALPIFYATGNRRNAFLWALLSGASEFVAALLGWAILANTFSQNAYAILFGLVGGMMVIISIRELLPTAHFYDPEDTCVTYMYIVGMAVMAMSLVMFQL